MTKEEEDIIKIKFDSFWNYGTVSNINPYEGGSPAFWAFEGYIAGQEMKKLLRSNDEQE